VANQREIGPNRSAAQTYGAVNQNLARMETCSGGSAIPMMQAADLSDRNHLPETAWFNCSLNGRVAIKRQMRS